jgi:hypothetical protein
MTATPCQRVQLTLQFTDLGVQPIYFTVISRRLFRVKDSRELFNHLPPPADDRVGMNGIPGSQLGNPSFVPDGIQCNFSLERR